MTESGTVTKLKKDKAVISFDRRSACDKCRMCAVSKGGMKVEILIKNTLSKNVGDTVCVEMGNKYIMTAALIVYVIPLILVAAGLLLGRLMGEMEQIILACVGLVVGFVTSALLDKILKKRKGFSPVMVSEAEAAQMSNDGVSGAKSGDKTDYEVAAELEAESATEKTEAENEYGAGNIYESEARDYIEREEKNARE
ncbi:MAG: SoxR reducing system RseC family protein [Clostridiaceae bacterium]|jgi:sigma-E factor negative regulatory protein RseC|nr:SoxR reducing system RseC family protein [Clostridiaceae bacterium]